MKESVTILGTEYKILLRSENKDSELKDCGGYCHLTKKRIVIRKSLTKRLMKSVLRHEIVHAFFYESGLDANSHASDNAFARDEEMIDWIAIQGQKLYNAWSEAGCLDD